MCYASLIYLFRSGVCSVITDTGNLYTWGTAYGNEVLGHDGVKYLPTPLKGTLHRSLFCSLCGLNSDFVNFFTLES